MLNLPQNNTAQGAANDSFAWSKAATGLSAAGDVAGGIGGFQLANYQAGVAARNAALATQNAAASETAGQYSAETALEEGGQVVGKQRAGYAASGIDVNIGTPQRVAESTQHVSAMDAAIARFNAAREGYAYKVQAATDTAQAGVYKSAGVNSLLSGIAQGGTSLVSGASSLSSKYAQWKLGTPPGANS